MSHDFNQYDPAFDFLLNATAVLFLSYRLRRLMRPRAFDLGVVAGSIGCLAAGLNSLFRAVTVFRAIPSRGSNFDAARWDSLLYFQIVFGSIAVFALVAIALSWQRRRWFFAVPVCAAATAAWLALSNAAPLA